MQTRTSGGTTTCQCDTAAVVPILDLICGVLSKLLVCLVSLT